MSEREELINVIWGTGDVPEQTAIEIADAVIGWQAAREQGGEAVSLVPELTAAKAEIEQLRGRVAEQQAALESICKCCWGGHEVMDVGQAATWMQFTAEKAIDDVPKTQAWLLRQKAEAVSGFAKHIKENHAEVMAVWILQDAEQYIQRLRDEADNLEVGGGQ